MKQKIIRTVLKGKLLSIDRNVFTDVKEIWEDKAEVSFDPTASEIDPAQDHFVVMWPESVQLESLMLYNMEGRLMHSIDVYTSPQIIDVSQLSNGMYMLFGAGEQGMLKKRVAVSH